MRHSERLPRAGFTLLEVMAAVVILGLVYVVLARGAMQGLQTEGDASRRLRASLLADRILNGMELSLAQGSAPTLGQTETIEDEFTVVTEVNPFDVATLLEDATGEPVSSASELELLKPTRGGTPMVLSITVRVAWTEGISEQQVTRDSFAFDLDAATPLLAPIQAQEKLREAQERATQPGRRRPGRPAALRPPDTPGDAEQ